ncbi:transglycosylase SLT domain-containing protein [Pseudoxanthomonas dokdonensis]|uniref:Murein transglycosylase n=1 Tax=Pseudoxanthomonas dokdonensis TaxID=344882 RepID=A0A0R0CSN3_9GAMM|nr:transglycosylase SLT domain-containing protein [Pseudoxanthomonas dokdonensis]KRG68910.1 murein transglycosylase [Pseudoxanthomonas dokdonensis]
MFFSPRNTLSWSLLAATLLFTAIPAASARVSARDQAAADALAARMAAAEKRYQDALVLTANADPKGSTEGDAALEDMEDVLDACIKQKGCQMHTLLATYKRLLKQEVDASQEDGDWEITDPLDDGSDHAALVAGDLPEATRTAQLLNDQRHAFDRMVQYNPAVQAGIRRWLTDMRGSLMDTYENYQYLRADMWPSWERNGLPEALLFGIMAKESTGRVHVSSRAGAAGLMQFMPATGQRFGLGPDGTGFDTRFDPRSVGLASAEYLNERMRAMNNSIEYALAAYNGGEGRAQRIYNENGGGNFWNESVFRAFPSETEDYVPMVIAASWLFLHPKQYGLKFPKINGQPATFRLARPASIYELTICMGNGGTREGFMRALRNLNPRYKADQLLPTGTTLKGNTRMASLYTRHCINGAQADLARTLVAASVEAALIRPSFNGNVAVGDVSTVVTTPPPGVPTTVATGAPKPVEPKARQARDYRIARGDTLGKVAQRYQCDLKTLARANGIKAPRYNVQPGQTIKLESCRK